jgi:hypothetical protein
LTALLARIAAAVRSCPFMSLTSKSLLNISGWKPNKPCGYTRSPIRTHPQGEFCEAHATAASFSMETFASSTRPVRRRAEISRTLPLACDRWAAVFPPCVDGPPFARSSTTLWKATNTWSAITGPFKALSTFNTETATLRAADCAGRSVSFSLPFELRIKSTLIYSMGRTFALSVFPSGPSQILYSSDPLSNLT